MKHTLATLLLLTLAAPAWGQDFEKGMQAYNRGDYATALRELRPLAKQGNGDAQSNLGYMYANGEMVLLQFSGELFAHSRPAISNWTGLW